MVKAEKKATVDIPQWFDEVMITRCAKQPQEDIRRKQVATNLDIGFSFHILRLYIHVFLTSLSLVTPHLRYPQRQGMDVSYKMRITADTLHRVSIVL